MPGRDANYASKYVPREGGRPVYVYSEDWQAVRDEEKYHRVKSVDCELDRIEASIRELLQSRHPADRQLGAAAALIVQGRMRAGSGYRGTRNFGAQNLQKRHFTLLDDGTLLIEYAGKGGVEQEREITDPLLVETLVKLGAGKRSRKPIFPNLSYRRLLDWFDQFGLLPKDFRTWWAARLFRECTQILHTHPLAEDEAERLAQVETEIRRVLEHIAEMLGHTPDTAKRSYVQGDLIEEFRQLRLRRMDDLPIATPLECPIIRKRGKLASA